MLSIQLVTLVAVIVSVSAQGEQQEPPAPVAPKLRNIRSIFRDFVRRNSAPSLNRAVDEKKNLKRFIDLVMDSNCGSFGCSSQSQQQLGSQGWGSQGYKEEPKNNQYYYDDDDYYYYYDEDYEK